MAMAIAKTLLDTLELRKGSVITENEIRALKKRWGRCGRLARKDPMLLSEERFAFLDVLPMQVSDEQGKKGLDYLRKLLLTKKGDLRRTKLTTDQTLGDGHVRILHSLDHFLFVGFREDHNHFGDVVALHPIYRAVSNDGSWFEYVARPWVGGQPEFSGVGQEMPS